LCVKWHNISTTQTFSPSLRLVKIKPNRDRGTENLKCSNHVDHQSINWSVRAKNQRVSTCCVLAARYKKRPRTEAIELQVVQYSVWDRHCTYKGKTEARSRNHRCRGKAKSLTYSQWVSVAFFIQHAKRMRRVILPSVACLAVPYFSTLSHKQHVFRDKSCWA
jgi:hypothetical protein